MAKKSRTKTKIDKLQIYGFYLSNGEFFARLTYTRAAIIEAFPNAAIYGGCVYLAGWVE